MVKKIVLVLFLIFITVVFLDRKVFAQTPSPLVQVECGYADDPLTSKCCETNFLDLEKAKQEAAAKAPIVAQILDQLPNFNLEEKLTIFNPIMRKCYLGEPDETSGMCICKQTNVPTPVKKLEEICNQFSAAGERASCVSCANGGGILTGLGCVPLNIGNFISDFLLGRLIGLAGIIALLCIVYAAFQMQTSQGNPEKIKKAQELLTSCIMGLMLIIFSVFILRLVGVNILKIPGFS